MSKQTMAIADITVGDRHRKELGDIAKLAASIKEQGLLQPIGILPDKQLVFGYRRLKACEDLGWTEIDVRIVNVTSIVAGEMHENEMRKQFTESERVAIFKSLRHHHGGDRKSKNQIPGRELDLNADQAAKMAGFAGRGTAYRAAKVVDSGIPELVEAMDKGDITVNAAEDIAKQPRESQAELLTAAKAHRAPVKREKKKAALPPQKSYAQVLAERDARLNAPVNGGTFITMEEREFPPPELANQQHPDYAPGVTYANVHRMEHGRIQLWPVAEKRQMDLVRKFDAAFGPCTVLDPADLDKLNAKRREQVLYTIRKVLKKFGHLQVTA